MFFTKILKKFKKDLTNLKDYDIINTQDKTTTVFKTRKENTMAMKMAEIQKAVKENAFAEIKSLFAEKGEQFGDFEIAVPVNIDGEGEFWAKVSVVCGQIKDTKSSKAFDPFVAQEEWMLDKELKAKEKAEKEKLKAEKIARSKSKAKAE